MSVDMTKWCELARQNIHNRPAGTGRLAGKIAIVTGAAQGFGKGIAEEMYKEGATIVIADLNAPLAETVAKELGERAVSIAVYVADEESVASLIAQTVEKHVADPAWMGDIIAVNSKSGLEGSNKNAAYAGSKFGGIGLTQSFALELCAYNIKVNAVCPGNYLEGPLWMDPERGLFVQYLKAGKVPGAKTTEDVKRFYEAKVPMNRGCLPIDVARAIFYCVEQKYETGQAIPVTGGQVMLN